MQPIEEERRRMKRFPMQLPVHIKLGGELGNVLGVTRDISAGGIYFYLSSDIGDRPEIDFIVTFPPEITMVSRVKVRCLGRVVRTDRKTMRGTGVAASIQRYEFLKMADGAHA